MRHVCRVVGVTVLAGAGALAGAARADEVTLTTGIRLRGRVLEADDQQVILQSDDGRRLTLARPKVARIELTPPAVLRMADDLDAGGRFGAAAEAYRSAMGVLGFGLLRDQTAVKLVHCLVASGDEAAAVDAFLDLAAQRPQAAMARPLPVFGLPMKDPAGVLAVLAKRRLNLPDDRLLSLVNALAFWACLSDGKAAEANRLADDLSAGRDADTRSLAAVCRAWLAYRTGQPAAPTASENASGSGAAEAARQVEAVRLRLTPAARPHGDLLLAQCCHDLGREDEAVLAAVRVAFGYEDEPHLAAEGLYLAGRSFEALGRGAQALAMFRRLIATYPASARVTEARRRLEALKPPSALRSAGSAQSRMRTMGNPHLRTVRDEEERAGARPTWPAGL